MYWRLISSEQEKHVKYNHLLANAAAIQNAIDLTRAVPGLHADGYVIQRDDLVQLSPYQARADSSDLAIARCRVAHSSRWHACRALCGARRRAKSTNMRLPAAYSRRMTTSCRACQRRQCTQDCVERNPSG
jgi:hypothetical protein